MIERSLPIVFLHAFPLDSRMWSEEAERYAGRGVLTPNFPGFGGRPPEPVGLADYARHVIREMDRAGFGRAIVVGLSMGGYIAFRLHSIAPERVAGLVLVDTRAGADSPEGAAKRVEQADRVLREGVGWMPDALIPNLLGETTRRGRPDVVQRVREMILDATPEGVANALRAMKDRPDSSADLAGIQVPVLAIVGEEDALTPPSEARQIAEGVRDGRLVTIPGAGHLSKLEEPRAFGEALAEFLG